MERQVVMLIHSGLPTRESTGNAVSCVLSEEDAPSLFQGPTATLMRTYQIPTGQENR